ncbi:hypothetical protein LMG31506_00240 [Cupriavidus yeoncheonensis]|uniref:Uncharacterized protein n=1 Tax=Cupriavidus yeoncheonensis TaxID=1462994 RepID=A0A916NBX3_9BURK|nr:hypothetical protein [Cupriavidus yeoncheonensis]CAG2126923.1 hypothetical protein LMG31506_00240 [Cupriavidus yeoncheonensis]
MPAVYPKLLTSQDYGAPTLPATAGSLIGVLDACLKDGYGSRPIGAVTVSGTTAQANVGTGHGLLAGQVILIAGANESQHNGEFKIAAIGQNTVTYTVPAGTPSPATGTITFKMAPLGWNKVFSGTNKAVYRTAATSNTVGLYLRVDDNPTALGFANRVAQVTAYELMTDVDTGFYAVPRPTQNTLNWPKSDNNTGTNGGVRNWAIYGDDRFFYFWVNPSQQQSVSMNGLTVGFGDLDAPQSIDAYGAMLTGYNYDSTQSASVGGGDLAYSIASPMTAYCPRPPNGIGTPQALYHLAPGVVSGSVSGNIAGLGIAWPDATTGGFFLNNVLCTDGKGFRGWLPGMHHIIQALPLGNATTAVIQHLGQIDGMRNLLGRKLGFMSSGAPQVATYIGSGYFFDLTGPIRNYN